MAEIHIYSGPMASGKSSELLKMIHMYSNTTKEEVLLINFKGDDRGGDHDDNHVSGATTHAYGDSSLRIPLGKYVRSIRVNALSEIEDSVVEKYSVIGIDEAQFYPDLEVFIRKHFFNCGLTFYLAGLKFDSDNEPFGQLGKLENIATTSQKFHSICTRCDPKHKVPAGFTFFHGSKGKEIVSGGLDKYQPLCARHYFNIE